jgi:hypothetical protein
MQDDGFLEKYEALTRKSGFNDASRFQSQEEELFLEPGETLISQTKAVVAKFTGSKRLFFRCLKAVR